VLCRLVLAELGIASAFDVVLSADDVARGKPDPEIYLLAARRLGLTPRECLVFEDSPGGVRAARAAGMNVIAIATAPQAFAADAQPHLTLGSLTRFARTHAEALWADSLSP
jgi:sugar-phosphatase